MIVEPRIADYPTLPLTEAFDWNAIVNSARETGRAIGYAPLYVVAFRSTLRPDADIAALLERDRRAHAAALASPALIHYFGGVPDENGQALSFCLWQDPTSAKVLSRDKAHTDAKAMIHSYVRYSLEKYLLHHEDGNARLEPFSET